jgi:hypothetical protein
MLANGKKDKDSLKDLHTDMKTMLLLALANLALLLYMLQTNK